MERWSILIEKEYLKFSCAHFLIFPDGSKERLHGHNYQVTAEVDGNLVGALLAQAVAPPAEHRVA